ncbi:MAG: hypothetical protein LQ342_005810 [Letrouitia transgressa]|nr:MAG: hypothetical protein LQ342_005810 [Letrouitia transgressa]
MESPTASLGSLSHLESLVLVKNEPAPVVTRQYHPNFSFSTPANRLLSLLPRNLRLSLRVVSTIVKTWVEDSSPALLSRLQVDYPRSDASDGPLLTAIPDRLLQHCQHLIISLLPSTTRYPQINSANTATVVSSNLKGISNIRLIPPTTNSFYPLLDFPQGLQINFCENVTHLHAEPLSLSGLYALRRGNFTSFSSSTWTDAIFWRKLKSVRIGMVSEWIRYKHESSDTDATKEDLKRKEESYRQGIQVLHDFVFQFSLSHNLEVLHFEWLDAGQAGGPNPLLLPYVVGEGKSAPWFSAQATRWKGLNEVHLGGTRVSKEDAGRMLRLIDGLERMLVWAEMAERDLSGKMVFEEAKKWLVVNIGGIDQPAVSKHQHGSVNTGEGLGMDEVDVAKEGNNGESMVVPFKLDIENRV